MAEHTLTFDEKVKGWTSFHSFIPEYMVNLNNDFYTFKNGQLYFHNGENNGRNEFYGTEYNTEIEVMSNASPSDVKVFKTIEIEGDSSDWDVTIITDLDRGHVDKSSFKEEEGFYSTHIRRDADDDSNTELLSVQGIGNLQTTVTSTSDADHTFSVVPGSVSIGDVLFRATAGSYERIGTITARANNTLTVGQASILATANDFIFASKSPIAESYGLKGYYASIRLVTDSTDAVELYAVNSEISKSYR